MPYTTVPADGLPSPDPKCLTQGPAGPVNASRDVPVPPCGTFPLLCTLDTRYGQAPLLLCIFVSMRPTSKTNVPVRTRLILSSSQAGLPSYPRRISHPHGLLIRPRRKTHVYATRGQAVPWPAPGFSITELWHIAERKRLRMYPVTLFKYSTVLILLLDSFPYVSCSNGNSGIYI